MASILVVAERAAHAGQFNTKKRNHMFCPKCGTSIGIDYQKLKVEDPTKTAFRISVSDHPCSEVSELFLPLS